MMISGSFFSLRFATVRVPLFRYFISLSGTPVSGLLTFSQKSTIIGRKETYGKFDTKRKKVTYHDKKKYRYIKKGICQTDRNA